MAAAPAYGGSVTQMSYYDFQNEVPNNVHPLDAEESEETDQAPELIVCDGGPDCIYNHHYQPTHLPLEEIRRM